MAPPKKGDLADEEKELINAITAVLKHNAEKDCMNDAVQPTLECRRINDKEQIFLFQHGMTPLMHAAYKGKEDMCKLLLQHGADVNCNEQEHGYTALMFAGFSGNKNITYMMLEAGAETNVVNSVGRTAAQMAAFVGQHDCVTVINNFFPRERLDYYTKPQGLDKEAKLPPKLAGPLHKIIMMTNLHPVKIVMMVRENVLLADAAALGKCYRVLDLICEKCFKQRDMNEVLAMKMHYISFILQKCITFLKDREDKLDGLIKSLLKGRDTDGFPSYQEKFIRECIRKFPYCDATLLQQLVRSIAPVEIYSLLAPPWRTPTISELSSLIETQGWGALSLPSLLPASEIQHLTGPEINTRLAWSVYRQRAEQLEPPVVCLRPPPPRPQGGKSLENEREPQGLSSCYNPV
ncbi:UNVERIFIED_CONTAM: hypothetical protein FKN15_042902 [Acipenser sinensis]